MSGLFKTFKISEQAAQDGILVDFKEAPNSDGTIPGFYVRFQGGKGSAAYAAAIQVARKPFARRIEQGDVKAQESFTEIINDLYCDFWISGWENVFDEDDQPLEYSKEACRELMRALPTVRNKLIDVSSEEGNFRQEQLKDDAKN